jgi:hypothetical protein
VVAEETSGGRVTGTERTCAMSAVELQAELKVAVFCFLQTRLRQ